jgi:hypothetical protein
MRIGDGINAFGDLRAIYGGKPYKYPWAGNTDVFGIGAAAATVKKAKHRRHPHGMFGMGVLGQQTDNGVPFEVTVVSMPGSIGVPGAQLTLTDPDGKFIDVEITDSSGKGLILAPGATFWDKDYVLRVTSLPKGYGSPVPAQQAVTAGKNDIWSGRDPGRSGASYTPHKVTFVVQALEPVPPVPLSPEEQITWDQIQAQNQNQPPLVVGPPYVAPSPAPPPMSDEEQITWNQINPPVVQVPPKPVAQVPKAPVQPAQPKSQPVSKKPDVQKASMLPADLEKYMPYILVGGVALLIGFVVFPNIIGGRK